MAKYKLKRPSDGDLASWAAKLRDLPPGHEDRRAAARAALPAAWRTRDKLVAPELPPVDDLELWRSLGASQALELRRPPTFPTSPVDGLSPPYAVAYATGYVLTMKGHFKMVDSTTGPMVPAAALAFALVAAQKTVPQLQRDGDGDKGAYTTSDAIAAAAREHLSNHGLAWMRTLTELRPGVLMHSMEDPQSEEGTGADIGYRCYAGDLHTTWLLVHEGGGQLGGSSVMPVITSKGTPHDKAVAASATYLAGQTLRGILCWDRESKDAVDKRKEEERSESRGQRRSTGSSPPKPRDLGPRCTGPAQGIADANNRRARILADAAEEPATISDVIYWGLGEISGSQSRAKYKPGNIWRGELLTIVDGNKVRDILKARATELGLEPEPPASDEAGA